MTLDELIQRGVHTRNDGNFLRSGGMTVGEDTFDILRAFVEASAAHRVVWFAGARVRQRFLNREYLGSPREFKRAAGDGDDTIIGQLRYGDVYGFTDEIKWHPETLIAVALDRNNNVRAYTGVRINIDLEEHPCTHMKSVK
jgi:hypothetical protein